MPADPDPAAVRVRALSGWHSTPASAAWLDDLPADRAEGAVPVASHEAVPAARDEAVPAAREEAAREAAAEAALDGATLRRRALASAFEAYTAVHGHAVHRDELAGATRTRWATPRRAATAGVVLLVLLGGTLVLRALLQVPSVVVPDHPTDGGAAPVASREPAVAPDTGSAPGVDQGVVPGLDPGTGAAQVVVHVVGEVARPGLVRLPAGARVADALDAAGGPTARADLTTVNLARTVVDGEQVLVPRPGDPPPGGTTGGGAGAGAPTAAAPPLDLNAADPAALEGLPGIGPVLAERVVAWRTEHGRFTTVDELSEVSGVGPAVLEQVRPLVTVG